MINLELRLANSSLALEILQSVTFVLATLGNGADNLGVSPGK